MFRYELLAAEAEPSLRFEGALEDGLVAAGYTPAGRYRAAYQGHDAFAGEILVDPNGTVAASINQHKGALNASLHTELADGTYVITEMLPPKSRHMLPGLTLPVPGTRMRFPEVTTTPALCDEHARHVAEVAGELGTTIANGMSAERYVALRHGEQRKRAPLRNFQERATVWSMLVGIVGAGLFAGVGKLLHFPPALSITVMLTTVLGTMIFGRRLGFGVIAPWLMRRGWGPSWEAPAPPTSSEASTIGPVELRDPGVGSILFAAGPTVAVLASLAGYVASTIAGSKTSVWSWLPLVIMAMNSTLADVVMNRRAFRKTVVKLTVDRHEVRGPRVPVRRERIAGAVVGVDQNKEATFCAVDGKGRVVLRASGTPDDLAALEQALAPKRQRLPLAHRFGLSAFGAGAATFSTAMAMYLGGVRSDLWIAALGAGVVVAPSLGMLRRPSVEIGADGLLFASARGRETFVPWTEIASLTTGKGEKMIVTLKDGDVQHHRGALPGVAARVAAAWTAHEAREATRDDAKAARRRVADTAAGAYRVTLDDPDALAETVLDSTEDQSVRVKAARKLARHEDAEARAEAAERVADPAVKRELSPPEAPPNASGKSKDS